MLLKMNDGIDLSPYSIYTEFSGQRKRGGHMGVRARQEPAGEVPNSSA
jgi:hypothetical protein